MADKFYKKVMDMFDEFLKLKTDKCSYPYVSVDISSDGRLSLYIAEGVSQGEWYGVSDPKPLDVGITEFEALLEEMRKKPMFKVGEMIVRKGTAKEGDPKDAVIIKIQDGFYYYISNTPTHPRLYTNEIKKLEKDYDRCGIALKDFADYFSGYYF